MAGMYVNKSSNQDLIWWCNQDSFLQTKSCWELELQKWVGAAYDRKGLKMNQLASCDLKDGMYSRQFCLKQGCEQCSCLVEGKGSILHGDNRSIGSKITLL